MNINLSSAELDIAVEEYLTRRGIDKKSHFSTVFKGGRKGNGSTAIVTIVPASVDEYTSKTHKVYAMESKPVTTQESTELEESTEEDSPLIEGFEDVAPTTKLFNR